MELKNFGDLSEMCSENRSFFHPINLSDALEVTSKMYEDDNSDKSKAARTALRRVMTARCES
jgi:hypothetical protein